MKCWYHPDEDAVNTCIRCGNSICEKCSTRSQNTIICVECIKKEALSNNHPINSNNIKAKRKTHPILIIIYVSVGLGLLSFCTLHLPNIVSKGYWTNSDVTGLFVFIFYFVIIMFVWGIVQLIKKATHRIRNKKT